MRILPVTARFFTNNTNTGIVNRQNTYKPQFTADDANDTFQSYSILDMQLEEMQDEIKNKIEPYKEMIKDKFCIIGKIGYDTQEKLKLIKNYETQLMNKKFDADSQQAFKKAEQKTKPYEEYQKNIKEFERNEKLVNSNPYYSAVSGAIEKKRAKVYRDSDEFAKLEPLYEKIQSTKQDMSEELDSVNSRNLPEFYPKVKDLDDKNRTAVMLALVSGYPETVNISKKSAEILKAYENNSKPSYKLLEDVEALNSNIQSFEHSIENNNDVIEEMDKFIDDNKDYEKNSLQTSEIKNTYEGLLQKADTIINRHAQKLMAFFDSDNTKVSPRIIDRTLKSQVRANKEINRLIQKEKQKIYDQSASI